MGGNWPRDIDVLALAKPFVKQREGFRAKPYLDQAGLATVGYGTRFYPMGRAVSMDDPPIDAGFAEVCLTAAMTKVLDGLRTVEHLVPTIHEAAAILSLAYNIGFKALASSTLLRLYNSSDIPGTANQFLRWDHVREGAELVEDDGLKTRRNMERSLFLTPDA